MTDTIGRAIFKQILGTHELMLRFTGDLTDEQIALQPGPDAPPIGWHLWHASRYADRMQASFRSDETGPDGLLTLRSQIWVTDGLAEQWGLELDSLGVLETGMGMEIDVAVALSQVGKSALLDYAGRTFAAVDAAIADLDSAQLQALRTSLREYRIDDGALVAAPGRETTVILDLLFYLAHLGRHIGMIEALRGATLAMPGI